jgi:hypothetical protein
MTVATTTSRVEYSGNAVTLAFSVPFYFLANGDLKVFLAGVLQTLTTHYSVSGAGNPAGGTVTFVTAPGSGAAVVVLRDPAVLQETDYAPNDPFPAESHEQALDKLTMIAQRLTERAGRSAALPDGYVGGASPSLPVPGAGQYLRWNVAGTALEAVSTSPDLSTFTQSGAGAVARSWTSKVGEVISRSDFDSDSNFNAAAAGKVSIDGTNKLAAPRFEGTATDDSGTPDAIFRVTRTHTSAASPHSFRDQTTFAPTSAGVAACSYDAALTSSGAANQDHTIAFQSRNVHSGSGTLTNFWGFGSFNVANGPVTNSYGSYVATLTGSGTVANEYGFYCANLTKGTNKYPIFIANNLGTNSIGAATNFNNNGVVSVGGTVKVFIGDAGNGYKSVAYNHNMQSNTYDYADQIQSMYFGPQDITFRSAPVGVAGATPTFTNIVNIRTDSTNPSFAAVFPAVNDVSNLGISGFRWKEIFCTNGTINTSDARAKTEVRDLTAAELAAAKDLAKAIGGFKWLASVAKKGESARTHIGMTVQRAMEIMQSHGLDPVAYGLICYDKWDDEFVDHPAVYHQTTNEDDEVVQGEIKDPAWREQTRKAGDSYGFRSDQLALFILRGLEARLSALEEK